MDIKKRRFVAFLFIAIFLIGTPILLLFTAGYRYNLKKMSLQKTGSFVVKTKPSGAAIFFNDEDWLLSTPNRINNILPEEYFISLRKEGYYDWQKKLKIDSQKTTFAENVHLFKIFEKEPLSEEACADFDLSEKKFNFYTVFNKNKTDFFLLINGSAKSKLLFSVNGEISDWQVYWNENQTNGLVYSKAGIWRIKTTIPRQAEKLSWPITEIDKVEFVEETPYVLANQKIYREQSGRLTEIYRAENFEKISDFSILENNLFIIKNSLTKNILLKEPLDLNSTSISKSLELKDDQFQFLDKINGRLLLQDKKTSTIYVLNSEIDKIEWSQKESVGYDFLPEKNYLLVFTGQEIYFVDLSKSEASTQLLTRYGNGVQKALWHFSGNYVFILHQGKLAIWEMDDRNGHFSIIIDESNITDFTVDENSENLIFAKEQFLWNYELN